MRTVIRVDQSPTHDRRWVLTLVCGHEARVTSKRRPQRLAIRCPVCEPQVIAALAEGENGGGA